MNGTTIYHVCFGDDNHHYFGSIAAIFDTFNSFDLGVKQSYLYGFNFTKPYRNEKCIIYKSQIHRKHTLRGRKKI